MSPTPQQAQKEFVADYPQIGTSTKNRQVEVKAEVEVMVQGAGFVIIALA